MTTSPRTRNTIVLSLDGVLVDTAPVVAHAMTEAMRHHSPLHFSPSAVANFVGLGPDQMFDRTLGAAGISLDREARADCLAAFEAAYRCADISKVTALPFAEQGLRRFAEQGVRVAVCANANEESAVQMLDSLGLLELVTVVSGTTSGKTERPYVTGLYNAMSRVGARPNDTVVVSASAVELLAARSHGIPGIGINMDSRRSFFDGSTTVIDSLVDLFDVPRATDDWSWEEKPLPMRETHQWLDRLLVAASSAGR